MISKTEDQERLHTEKESIQPKDAPNNSTELFLSTKQVVVNISSRRHKKCGYYPSTWLPSQPAEQENQKQYELGMREIKHTYPAMPL